MTFMRVTFTCSQSTTLTGHFIMVHLFIYYFAQGVNQPLTRQELYEFGNLAEVEHEVSLV